MTDLQPGVLIEYPYLWVREQEAGETEGRKTRVACVTVALVVDGRTHMALVALSAQPPAEGDIAIEVPDLEMQRSGLRAWRKDTKKVWVRLNEYNYDVAEESFYYDPGKAPVGRFSKKFHIMIAKQLTALIRSKKAKRVDRTI